MNVPNVDLTMPFISEKDYGDICFAVENDYDFIAASFVRTAEDVMEIRKILAEKGGEDIKIISKIENMQVSAISMTSSVCPMVSWWRVVTWVLKSR